MGCVKAGWTRTQDEAEFFCVIVEFTLCLASAYRRYVKGMNENLSRS